MPPDAEPHDEQMYSSQEQYSQLSSDASVVLQKNGISVRRKENYLSIAKHLSQNPFGSQYQDNQADKDIKGSYHYNKSKMAELYPSQHIIEGR